MQLSDSVTAVKGIGEKAAIHFSKLEIHTVSDLLEHYPRDYHVFDYPVPISRLTAEQTQSVECTVCSTPELKRIKNRQILTCKVKDPSGLMQITWYNQPYLKNTLRMGTRYVLRGRVVWRMKQLAMEQPSIYTPIEYRKLLHVLQPVYSLTEGITNNAISKAVDRILFEVEFPEDFLPKQTRKKYELMQRKLALLEVHFPKSKDTMLEARKRLVFDEFFLFAVNLRNMKEDKAELHNQYPMERCEACTRLIKGLPYTLTGAQEKVWEQLQIDMTGKGSMNRLIQGDVGSGKTILSVLALLLAAKNGYQGCMMVPTEVLAKQHYQTLTKQLVEFGIRVELLTGSMTAAEKKKSYERIASHEADIIIGTHALIQEKVVYDKLALVITDEQHRFGVRQRASLFQKGEQPHVLVMSATPIPRTLSIILYGDLDISILDEMPADRLPIKNCVVGISYRPTAFKFIEKQVRAGKQAYVICPMVEESDEIEAEDVISYCEFLKESLSSDINVEYLHGKMKPKEKNDIMERYAMGHIHVLVSTTVIEVGVDVPNATVMMIENAERFGLAQLHQLRGRVGRGKDQSYCIMVSSTEGEETKKRLDIMNQSNDGFFIAEEDLKLRGPGDIFGIRQSGEMEFKIGDIYRDVVLLKQASEAAKELEREEFTQIMKLSLLFDKVI